MAPRKKVTKTTNSDSSKTQGSSKTVNKTTTGNKKEISRADEIKNIRKKLDQNRTNIELMVSDEDSDTDDEFVYSEIEPHTKLPTVTTSPTKKTTKKKVTKKTVVVKPKKRIKKISNQVATQVPTQVPTREPGESDCEEPGESDCEEPGESDCEQELRSSTENFDSGESGEYSDYKYMLYLGDKKGYMMKPLFQMISQCFDQCTLIFSSEGVRVEAIDDHDPFHVNMKLKIPHNKSDEYMWGGQENEERVVGIQPSDLSKLLRSIRRKYTVRIYELKSNPDKLNVAISVDPKDPRSVSTGDINIFKPKQTNVKLSNKSNKPIMMNTSFFQAALNQARDINNKQIKIWAKSRKIIFRSEVKGIIGRGTETGKVYPNEKNDESFTDTFSFTIIDKFKKVGTLSDKILFYLPSGQQFMRFVLSVGTFGKMEIIINNYDHTHNSSNKKTSRKKL